MNQAAQRTGRYSEQNFCAIPRPCAPCAQASMVEISAFERYRALQNLQLADAGLIILLHIPPTELLQPPLSAGHYLDALLAETSLACKHLPDNPQLHQLHVYGDVALFSQQQLQQLFAALRQHLQLPSNNFAWFSIGITPGHSSWAALGKLRDAGFNRITLNCNEPCFQAAESLYDAARALQFNTITMRARYSPDGSGRLCPRLQAMARLQPDRIVLEHADESLYDSPPDAALVAYLKQAGYVQATHSCFVLPDDELTEYCDSLADNCISSSAHPVLGLGAGASSQLERLYFCNDSPLEPYIRTLAGNQLPPARGYRSESPSRPK
ncbi:hypothetical protein [Thiopseudomonas denitrificans]|uniref:Coproporphyrinogen III oxidase-like Fe-S oxidoreductase n=1 Tax=Thiopseudomonas denitrificans TaxID=1501432 RepID=A0A4R6TTB1_9GAMM|nr:hypothetical protein [Thiopseudomonas denitrificans]TDQ36900.1 coproporphyrinogen III oxidase-like Fe-S oxidoreductase [Thiopseudomonas denitrificans]